MSRNSQASKAKPRRRERCYLGCTVCQRRCNGTAWGRQTHRFDCCGVIEAHVPHSDRDGWFRSGMSGGYLTGPSQTQPRDRQPSKAIPLVLPGLADVVRRAADFDAQVAKVRAVMDITHDEAVARVRALAESSSQQRSS